MVGGIALLRATPIVRNVFGMVRRKRAQPHRRQQFGLDPTHDTDAFLPTERAEFQRRRQHHIRADAVIDLVGAPDVREVVAISHPKPREERIGHALGVGALSPSELVQVCQERIPQPANLDGGNRSEASLHHSRAWHPSTWG